MKRMLENIIVSNVLLFINGIPPLKAKYVFKIIYVLSAYVLI